MQITVKPTRRAAEERLSRHKALLVESIERHVLPALTHQGFLQVPRLHEGPEDPKNADTFPFGLLKRVRPGGVTDLVEIQFMTYQRAAFRVNACAVPKEGLMTMGGHKTANQLHAGGLHDHFEMYDFPRWWIWFSLWFWRFRHPVSADYDRLASRVVKFLPEIEMALSQGQLGPHMRYVTFSSRKLIQ